MKMGERKCIGLGKSFKKSSVREEYSYAATDCPLQIGRHPQAFFALAYVHQDSGHFHLTG